MMRDELARAMCGRAGDPCGMCETDADRLLASGVLDEVKADAWAEGYCSGVADEATSQDWTNGQMPPARANPYRKEGAAR